MDGRIGEHGRYAPPPPCGSGGATLRRHAESCAEVADRRDAQMKTDAGGFKRIRNERRMDARIARTGHGVGCAFRSAAAGDVTSRVSSRHEIVRDVRSRPLCFADATRDLRTPVVLQRDATRRNAMRRDVRDVRASGSPTCSIGEAGVAVPYHRRGPSRSDPGDGKTPISCHTSSQAVYLRICTLTCGFAGLTRPRPVGRFRFAPSSRERQGVREPNGGPWESRKAD